jgi:tRNA(Ile)-lysidine synthase
LHAVGAQDSRTTHRRAGPKPPRIIDWKLHPQKLGKKSNQCPREAGDDASSYKSVVGTGRRKKQLPILAQKPAVKWCFEHEDIILKTMVERVSHFIRSEDLIGERAHVLVGLSGGPDSTCLLHVLVNLGFRCTAATLHHSQRPEADDEIERCRAFATSLQVPFVSAKANVPQMAEEQGMGLEEAGRKARYAFFEQAAIQTGCDLIATAHTLDDHLETVLLNLARGTGMSGLLGIPIRRDNIVRPVLCLKRADTHEYCHQHGLLTAHDPANDDIQFSRARVRHRVVPELTAINSSVLRSAFRMSRILREEDMFLNGMAAAALEQSEFVKNRDLAFLTQDCELILSRPKITSLPPVLFKRAMILGVKALGSSLESKQLEAIVKGIGAQESGSVTAPDGNVTLTWSKNSVVLQRIEQAEPFREILEYPGTVESPQFGWQLSASIASTAPANSARRTLNATIPFDCLRRPLVFRNVLRAERMQPLGFYGKRKVSDLMSEAGVSKLARARLPVVCDVGGPLWIPGVCLDQRAAPAERIGPALALRFQALGGL